MSTATKTTGAAYVKVPKDTLAVITATSDAMYYQSVTVSAGDDVLDSFRGNGNGGIPLKLKTAGAEYLKIEPSSSEREIQFSFNYAKSSNDDNWRNPQVYGPHITPSNGIRVVGYGTEDSTDNSWHDSSVSVFFFPKSTAKKA